mmetsp:Transcript_39501/g.77729  ORF Transcript_39501/g.77729 Transcript_39501/m.77729 type:complete len:179 (-) Transcript_39501:1631-2167(-)
MHHLSMHSFFIRFIRYIPPSMHASTIRERDHRRLYACRLSCIDDRLPVLLQTDRLHSLTEGKTDIRSRQRQNKRKTQRWNEKTQRASIPAHHHLPVYCPLPFRRIFRHKGNGQAKQPLCLFLSTAFTEIWTLEETGKRGEESIAHRFEWSHSFIHYSFIHSIIHLSIDQGYGPPPIAR